MSRNRNVPPQEKLKAVKKYLAGNGSSCSIAKELGVHRNSFCKWVAKYKACGINAFIRTAHTTKYSQSFKETVAKAYLNGEGSLIDIAIRFKIPTHDTVMRWVLEYNGHKKLKATGTGGNSSMTNGRKTTFDERVEIVRYCIENQKNYSKTAVEYGVSYQQVYAWCKKYETDGIVALQDRRGRKKLESEMSEIERLRAENKLLRAENRRKELENIFLKKLEEIERRGY